jgi:hypothetical protein
MRSGDLDVIDSMYFSNEFGIYLDETGKERQ